jgi:tetratricopeptide (TPR) repeat protein
MITFRYWFLNLATNCMTRIFFLLIIYAMPYGLFAQKNVADSINQLIKKAKNDTARVRVMCDIAYDLRVNDPERGLQIASEAVSLSKKVKYSDGQSKSLGTLAIIFRLLGNFPLALQYNLKRLELVEKTNSKSNLAGVMVNIGFVYVNQEEYKKALEYYQKADSVIKEVEDAYEVKFTIALNTGDVYDKLNINDSAFNYFNKSLNIARQIKNKNYEGMSMVGLGNNYLKTDQYLLAQANYKSSIINLKEAENDDMLCEAMLGLATLFKKLNQKDSALFYARQSLDISKKDGFLPRFLDAAKFLSVYFKDEKNIDSSFFYLNYVQNLNDSINSKSKIRESQILSSNEQVRQFEIAENVRIAKKERKQQLQLLFIAIFIPGFFMLTLLLSRIKLHVRLIKVLGILSLLILFEYLTLLLHPYVLEITHHTPVYEMLIFVSIAAILIPTHHRVENWLIKWLTKNRPLFAGNNIKIKSTKIIKKITEA